VRQGAFIALGMILVQQSEASSRSMSSTRALYTKVVSDKHEDPHGRLSAWLFSLRESYEHYWHVSVGY
jgi:26S proteasome regulatory subunit N2